MREHIVGYLLLVLGIGIMLFAVSQVYLLFTHQSSPYEVFKAPAPVEAPKVTMAQITADPTLATKLQSEMFSQVLQKEMGKSLNLGATLFFMYFIMTFGYRLALLGVQLVRPIKVAIRAKTVEVDHEETRKLHTSS
jgi:hypothetical protein